MLPAVGFPLPPIPGLGIDPNATFRFMVSIDGISFSAFQQIVLPSLTMQTEDVKEGGLNTYIHKLPGRIEVSTVKLKTGIVHADFMLAWYMLVYNGMLQAAKRTVIITLTDSLRIPVMIWTFSNAYPIKWTAPTLDGTSSTAAVEELELAHSGFTFIPG